MGMLFLLMIVVGVVVGITLRYSIWRTLRCSQCGAQPPFFKMPKSWDQYLWGDWTCSACGSELDRQGRLWESPPFRPVSNVVATLLLALMLLVGAFGSWLVVVQPDTLVPYQEYAGSIFFGLVLLIYGLISHPIYAESLKQRKNSPVASWLASKAARLIIILCASFMLITAAGGLLLKILVR